MITDALRWEKQALQYDLSKEGKTRGSQTSFFFFFQCQKLCEASPVWACKALNLHFSAHHRDSQHLCWSPLTYIHRKQASGRSEASLLGQILELSSYTSIEDMSRCLLFPIYAAGPFLNKVDGTDASIFDPWNSARLGEREIKRLGNHQSISLPN